MKDKDVEKIKEQTVKEWDKMKDSKMSIEKKFKKILKNIPIKDVKNILMTLE